MNGKHFKLILPDEGKDIFMPREGQTWGYRYGPSIMCHDGICEAWFASPGDGFEADWFTYRKSTDGGNTWSDERVVLTPTPNSMDWFSVCDPAVFKYGKYYYIGYTSTLFSHAGGVCNNAFVARSESATGPFEKWNGNGWGESRGECRWVGKPAPIFYFDEEWHNWGLGEPSFVVKDGTLYIYYTWTSRDANGRPYSETRVATADVTDENWPATIIDRGIAAIRNSGANDSYDVVYCEDLDKFIALSTDKRFTEDSFLSVSESDDGITFRRVNEIRVNTSFMLHNCGISGDCLHHIKKGDTLILGYAYGNAWGKWGTRFHKYDFEGMNEDFYNDPGHNVARDFAPWKRPDPMFDINLFATAKHYVRLYEGESVEAPLGVFDHCYQGRPAGDGVKLYNYDKEIIRIDGNKITALKPGYTYVSAKLGQLFCEFTVYVDTPDVTRDPAERRVTGFKPIRTEYVVNTAKAEGKQIRGIADYSDGTFFEICDPADGVTYISNAPELFAVTENGIVVPTGKPGVGTVSVFCAEKSFDVTVKIV